MVKEAIKKIVSGENLTEFEARRSMEQIMNGEATGAQIGAFLTGLAIKGETVDEITGCAKVMREKVTKINVTGENVVDTCGTGGDGKDTFNISTIIAFVVAGAGAKVAKHGNRAVSSRCGSADLLEGLGVKIDIPPGKVEKCIHEVGIGFMFAPLLHGAMKFAMPSRKEIGIRSIFNILGPLTNPAGVKHQVMGVFKADLTAKLAKVLGNLGSKHVLVVHGEDGLDEITITGKTKIAELVDGKIKEYEISPEDFGIKKAKIEDILGGDVDYNVKLATELLKGEVGPKRDIILLNAAAAIYAADLAKSLQEGLEKAKDSINTGRAVEKLEKLVEVSNK